MKIQEKLFILKICLKSTAIIKMCWELLKEMETSLEFRVLIIIINENQSQTINFSNKTRF